MSTAARHAIVERLAALKAVAVIRTKSPRQLLEIVQAIRLGGVEAIEVTMTVPNALEMIRVVSQEMRDTVLVGVGTVLDGDTAKRAIDAGARYVVSPIFRQEVIQAAHAQGVPAMPGCMTPTECQTAWEAGADIIKVFPADVVGMPFFKAVLAPLPHLKLMPTGGVSLTNAGAWIQAGAVAVGVGSALLDQAAIERSDYRVLTENARTLMATLAA